MSPLFGPTTLPTLPLTTTGRKSGQPRATALNYLPVGDRLLILGSNFGQSHRPAWTSNLLTHPAAMYRSYLRRTDRDLRLFALARD